MIQSRGNVLCMDMGERCLGMQPHGGEDKMADAVFNATKQQKEKGKSWWWQCVSVVLVAASASAPILCKLRCKLCKQFLSPSNPSNTCLQHLKPNVCKGYRTVGVKDGYIPEEVWGGGSGQQQQAGGSSNSSRQQTLMSNKRQATGQLRIDDLRACREKAKELLAMFFFNNSIALHLIEDKSLKAAFDLLGCELPTR